MSTSSDLSTIQATALASEVSLAKNYASKSIALVTSLTTEVQSLKTEVNINDASLNVIFKKVQSLCALLSIADISGVNNASFNYANL
jgi:hypothetical protein